MGAARPLAAAVLPMLGFGGVHALWASVAAGLMVLGHAAALVEGDAASPGLGPVATMLAGMANAVGGRAAGSRAAWALR